MNKWIVFYLITLISAFANAQEELDTSSFELIIPIEINDSKAMLGNIVNLSRKDFLTMAASFDDPSRLLTRYPGFTGGNDQNNSIIYHGMPSYMTGWSLYGSEIVNPNHLSTAGNVHDHYAPSSGGVNAFSGQVIGEFSFRANPDVNTSNDYFAGVSNIKLRTPYANKLSINTSLIGMELGVDLKSENSDFLINGRYSTVGLLSSLGLDFGDESINYLDLSAKYGRKLFGGRINVYGLYGQSSNFKEGLPSSESSDIVDATAKDHSSELLITGINFEKETSNGLIESTTNYSVEDQMNFLSNPFFVTQTNFAYKMLSHSSSYTHFLDKMDLEFNFRAKKFGNRKLDRGVFQYSVFAKHSFSNFWHFRFGLSLMTAPAEEQLNLTPKWRLNPSLGITKIHKNYNQITRFKFSRNQQLGTRPTLLLYNVQEFTSAYNFQLEIEWTKQKFAINAFYHHFDDVYQNPGFGTDYSIFDDFHLLRSNSFGDIAVASANIFGISFSKSTSLSDRMSLKLNTTFLKGFQKYQTNFFGSGEAIFEKSEIPYSLRFSSNILFSCKDFLIKHLDLSLSFSANDGKFIREQIQLIDPFRDRLPYFFRADARLNYHFKKKKRKYKSMLSLDIQNLTGRKNYSDFYFDQILQELIFQEQLGFIPILSWRVVI